MQERDRDRAKTSEFVAGMIRNMQAAQAGGRIGWLWHGFGPAGNLCENQEGCMESPESAVWATWNLHTNQYGWFAGCEVSESLAGFCYRAELFKRTGEEVIPFTHAGGIIGILYFCFPDGQDAEKWIRRFSSDIQVHVTPNLQKEIIRMGEYMNPSFPIRKLQGWSLMWNKAVARADRTVRQNSHRKSSFSKRKQKDIRRSNLLYYDKKETERRIQMSDRKMLPVGVESFEKIRKENFYYVDKTGLISDILHNWAEVNLFTRPRRFGKSLNMSMLKCFFEIGADRSLFDGLAISKEQELCEKYMGQFPLISISLKGVAGLKYEDACRSFKSFVGEEASRFDFLLESDRLSEDDKTIYRRLIEKAEAGDEIYAMSDELLQQSLRFLSGLLAKHYGRKVILLIDEYDVPLDKAFQHGYYAQMVMLIRNLFGNVLKTNPDLQFAILTGCLRISKESIFTGLNNMKVLSITDTQFDEYFGFTDAEVQKMLEYYGILDHAEEAKEWYDGYRFGNEDVYCPWDVINYCSRLLSNPEAVPEDFWANSSGNDIVRRFIDKADFRTRNEIEQLISGESVVKEVHQELTYRDIDTTIDNLWSVLLTTGYLTQRGRVGDNFRSYQLAIPNREIRDLFVTQIREWFRESTRNDPSRLEQFCLAFPKKNPETVEKIFGEYLWNTISLRDAMALSGRKEAFYHGILLGQLSYMGNWDIRSNEESGLGYGDILIEVPESRTGVVVELKYAESGTQMEKACDIALQQIEEKHYDAVLLDDGMMNIVKYGIACYKKQCRVKMGEGSMSFQ